MTAGDAPAASVLLVGCGRMGSALARGWIAQGTVRRIDVVEPVPGADDWSGDGLVHWHHAPETLAADLAPDVVVLALKPQTMAAALPAYRRFADRGALFLSIAAGKTLGFFARHLGAETAVVRAMPNTPAAIARGISVLCANAKVSEAQNCLALHLLAAVGEVAATADEALMDAVTAVSGSGPAYVFLLIETLTAAGIAAGLPPDLATILARETVAGAGELARVSAEPAARLRENVTSPGGTTRAALDVLMAENGLATLMTRAVAAATQRSRDLAD